MQHLLGGNLGRTMESGQKFLSRAMTDLLVMWCLLVRDGMKAMSLSSLFSKYCSAKVTAMVMQFRLHAFATTEKSCSVKFSMTRQWVSSYRLRQSRQTECVHKGIIIGVCAPQNTPRQQIQRAQ